MCIIAHATADALMRKRILQALDFAVRVPVRRLRESRIVRYLQPFAFALVPIGGCWLVFLLGKGLRPRILNCLCSALLYTLSLHHRTRGLLYATAASLLDARFCLSFAWRLSRCSALKHSRLL